jgi:hypothetical protein
MYKIKIIVVSLSAFILTSCATYYQKTQKFQKLVQEGKFDKAEKYLSDDKKAAEGKNRLLYLMNQGYVNWMMMENEESNQYLNQADIMIEDQLKKPGLEALALMTNPMIKPYEAEDFEKVMVNFFKSLNYIRLNDYESANVESRRINLKLNKLNDKYPDHKNRYQNDAFAHVMMGLIYDAQHDYNNAFIAYRNALEVYESDYTRYFGIGAPLQLKQDLLRTAYLTGFHDEVRYYGKKFNMDYNHRKSKQPELVFFWLNGFGPVKSEWSINFTKVPGEKGFVMLVNEELGLSFPVYIGNKSEKEKSAFSQLRFVRVAFPKYVERKPVFTSARLHVDNRKIQLELAEDINEIAFKTLHDRMLREMANSIARLATKKALELLANQEDENLGAVIGIANALTEKADTRNWQTLPYSISYARVPLKEGQNKVILEVSSPSGMKKTEDFTFSAKPGNTYFHYFHSLESHPVEVP